MQLQKQKVRRIRIWISPSEWWSAQEEKKPESAISETNSPTSLRAFRGATTAWAERLWTENRRRSNLGLDTYFVVNCQPCQLILTNGVNLKPWLSWVTASHLYAQFLPCFGFRVFEVWPNRYLMSLPAMVLFLKLCLLNVLMFISCFAEGSTKSLSKTVQQQNNHKRQLTGSRWILEPYPLPAGKIILMVLKLSFDSETDDWGFLSGRSILCEESWKETLFQWMFMSLIFPVCYPAVRAHEIQLQSTSLPELWGTSQILNENSALVIGLILLINFHTHSLAVLKCKLQTTILHVISLVWWHVFHL